MDWRVLRKRKTRGYTLQRIPVVQQARPRPEVEIRIRDQLGQLRRSARPNEYRRVPRGEQLRRRRNAPLFQIARKRRSRQRIRRHCIQLCHLRSAKVLGHLPQRRGLQQLVRRVHPDVPRHQRLVAPSKKQRHGHDQVHLRWRSRDTCTRTAASVFRSNSGRRPSASTPIPYSVSGVSRCFHRNSKSSRAAGALRNRGLSVIDWTIRSSPGDSIRTAAAAPVGPADCRRRRNCRFQRW